MTLEELREKSHQLPTDPGVYLMKDKAGKVIYVGKAKRLRNRVTSYFMRIEQHHPKVFKMVQHVDDFDFIVTGSEFEALVLECSLIKQYNPKYNILLKDDKGYHWVKITGGEYPTLEAAKQKINDGATYMGPFTSSFIVTQSVEFAKKAFGLPNCKLQFPRDFRKARPCLNFYIKQCCGVCTGKISRQAYKERLDMAMEYITTGSDRILKDLEEEMARLSANMEFERAGAVRDQIRSIKRLNQQQNVMIDNKQDMDAVAMVLGEGRSCAVVLKFRGGRLTDKEEFLSDESAAADMLGEFVTRYYTTRDDVPKEVLLEREIADAELLEQLLEEKRGAKVQIHMPQRGEKKKLVGMAYDNAATGISYRAGKTSKEVASLDELAKLLGLKKPPHYIESYDISNLGESHKVCGMVVFKDGKPFKQAYKKFKIATVSGQDDYASMREALTRRLTRLKNGDDDVGFNTTPDLILLDGGKGHVAAIRPLLLEMGLDIPVFGMVKDSKHRTRAIAEDGGEVSMSTFKSAFKLVTNIQDETHRFAIAYQRKLHKNSALKSELTAIPGVGDKRARQLLMAFSSLQEIALADADSIAAKGKVPQKTAQAVYEYFNQT